MVVNPLPSAAEAGVASDHRSINNGGLNHWMRVKITL